MKRLLIVLLIAVSETGCMGASISSGEVIEFRGTPRGVMAFSDMMNGAMQTAKDPARRPNQYMGLRKRQKELEVQESRETGLWSNWFGGVNKAAVKNLVKEYAEPGFDGPDDSGQGS